MKALFKEYGVSNSQAGKGSAPRPVDKTKFQSNFSKIKFGPSPAKKVTEGKGRTTFHY